MPDKEAAQLPSTGTVLLQTKGTVQLPAKGTVHLLAKGPVPLLAKLALVGHKHVAQFADSAYGSICTRAYEHMAKRWGEGGSRSLPDKWMRERGVPRTVSLVGLMVCTMLTAALNAFITLPLMPVSAFLTGFTFGGMQGVVPAVTSEIFGLRNFATNYALVQLGPATGSYTLATFLAGHLYEQRGRAHGDPAGTCRGRDCFRWTFIVVTGLSGVAAAVSLLLWRRTQHLYAKVVEHTRLERQRRGLAGEVAERRKIMRRVMEENKLLQSYLTRGRDMVAQLVAQLRDESVDKAAAVEQGLSQLQALGFEASELLSMQAEMYEQFEKLSPQAQ
eukprot:jgi/Botrbrau1/20750/Bobra.0058s0078.1